MKKTLYIAPLFALTVACAGFKPSYKIVDASENSRPNWLVYQNAYKSDKKPDEKKFRYFLNDAENLDQNLCVNLAETRATQRVASEISQEIMQKFKEQASSDDATALRNVKNTLEKNIQVNLHGVKVTGQYWEKRQYLQDMGAKEDKEAYHCHVAVSIPVSELTSALNAYKDKTLRQLKKDDQVAMKAAVDATINAIKTGAPLDSAAANTVAGANE